MTDTPARMRINVREEFASCVRSMGGIALDDSLPPNPRFSVADYWFPEQQVIAELKCLTDDLVAKTEFNQRISNLYASWVREGLLPRAPKGKVTLNLADLPRRCAHEFLDPVKRRLDVNTFKRANAQIKGTKKQLEVPNAKGLLLLVNDGDYMFPPEMMAHLLARSMKEQFKSINSAIYFSINELVTVPGIANPTLFWMDPLLPNREPVPAALREQIKQSWIAHHSQLVPEPIYEIEGDPEALDRIQFKRS